jgi:hypothetical protein
MDLLCVWYRRQRVAFGRLGPGANTLYPGNRCEQAAREDQQASSEAQGISFCPISIGRSVCSCYFSQYKVVALYSFVGASRRRNFARAQMTNFRPERV